MLRDWLVAKIRIWLGIECDSTALFARLETQERGLEKLAQAVAVLKNSLNCTDEEVNSLQGNDFAGLVARVKETEGENSRLQDTLRGNVSKIASLEAQVAKLRDIATAKPAKPAVIQAKNWSEYKRMAAVAEE